MEESNWTKDCYTCNHIAPYFSWSVKFLTLIRIVQHLLVIYLQLFNYNYSMLYFIFLIMLNKYIYIYFFLNTTSTYVIHHIHFLGNWFLCFKKKKQRGAYTHNSLMLSLRLIEYCKEYKRYLWGHESRYGTHTVGKSHNRP